MRKFSVFIFIFIFIFFTRGQNVYATGNVVINEFYVGDGNNQWVELFNSTDAEIDLSSWVIDDSGGTEKYTIPDGTVIKTKDFVVFESSKFNLNRATPDTIKLLSVENSIDTYSYEPLMQEALSIGRKEDGSSEWVIFNTATKGSSNNQSTIIPTSTPSPTLTPVPTNTPTPTKVPTPTKTPTPTKNPTPTKAPTPAKQSFDANSISALNHNSDTAENTPKANKVQVDKSNASASGKRSFINKMPTAVLGSQSAKNHPTKYIVSKEEVRVKGISETNFFNNTLVSVAGSGLLIGCAIILALRIRKQKNIN